MKRILLLLMLASFASNLLAEVVIISGIYQGKDLYVLVYDPAKNTSSVLTSFGATKVDEP